MKTGYLYLIILILVLSCSKRDEWLDKKMKKSDMIPTTLKDFQALLDNNELNEYYQSLVIASADNYFINPHTWTSHYSKQEKNAYIWASDIYEGEGDYYWVTPYRKMRYPNAVLDRIGSIEPGVADKGHWNALKGTALFFRALFHFDLVSAWAKPYDQSTAATDPGIPIRLTADINETISRFTVQKVYDQILGDLQEAIQLLPAITIVKTRPSKAAANALLSRIMLTMSNYEEALTAANAALESQSFLYQFSEPGLIDKLAPFPFPTISTNNKEVIFYATGSLPGYFLPDLFFVDSNLYRSYTVGDLRKDIFYYPVGEWNSFKGFYTGEHSFFAGIATNELYLNKAECLTRLGQTTEATLVINTLLQHRWDPDAFTPVSFETKEELLAYILTERNKELPFTWPIRWLDLRRLNKEPAFAITLKRSINDQEFILPPNDKRYVLPFPEEEIRLSGIEQNPR